MKSSLIINSIDANNQARQKSFPNINPNASNANVCTFAKKVNALTTNEFVSAIRVDKKPLDDSTPEPVVKQTPTLTLSEFTKDGTTYTATITYNGDGELTTTTGTIDDVTLIVEATETFSGTISAQETDNFLAASVEFRYVIKQTPTLTLSEFTKDGTTYTATITYNGDGELTTTTGTIDDVTLIVEATETFSGTLSAPETDNFLAASVEFRYVIKQTPTLSVSEFTKDGTTYTATITYTGDGELTTKLGTITDNTLTIEDADGTFNSTVSASETDNFLAATYAFSRVGKKTPSLSVGNFSLSGSNLNATISYTGDGTLSTNLGTISNNTLTVSNNSSTFYGTVSSSETENYIAVEKPFKCGVYLKSTVGGANLSGANTDDTLRVVHSTVVASGGAGNDSISQEGNTNKYVTLKGGAGNDTLSGTWGTVVAFYGEDGDDFIETGQAASLVSADGGAGNDTIIGNSYEGTIVGGAGNDSIRVGQNSKNTIIHNTNTGNDTIVGMTSFATLKISGSYSTQVSGSNVLVRTGNDTITLQDAMLTADTLNINSTAIALDKTVTLTDGNDFVSKTRHSITIDAGDGNDSINNTGVSVSIDAGDGNDSINNSGSSVTISGGAGKDSITNSSSNVLFTYAAGDGNDIINGFNETSTLSIVGASYSTQASGIDVLVHVGDGTITLKGVLSSLNAIHINNDEIALPNAVTLTSGDDTISNAKASVSIYGGEGNDSIYNTGASVSIYGGEGNDTVNTSSNAANVVIYGGEGNDSIYSAHINTIYGGAGDDTITNNGAREVTIDGGAGNDVIYQIGRLGSVSGGTGDDLISLGAKATQTANSIFYNYGDGNDTIINFKTTDTLYVTGSTFTTTTSGDDVIVNVGSEYITIQGGATVSPLNIVSA